MELIKQKLELDLFHELKEELEIDDIELKRMIKKEVDVYEFNFQKKNKNKYSHKTGSKDSCEARLWNSHYEKRCSNQKKVGCLCLRHHNILEKNGKLEFGLMNEKRPDRNSKGDVLRWYDDIDTVDKQLDLIMNTHTKKTLEGIHYSLNKDK
tara:strand:+ start:72 stop:527 length:456 start_codon:yes stop_codon:yes gene_type:complete